MTVARNHQLIELTKEIVVARLSSARDTVPNADEGASIADYMQSVYDKLCELDVKVVKD